MKIIIHVDENVDIIGVKEDIAAYCEKFGDVRFIDVVDDKPPVIYEQTKI